MNVDGTNSEDTPKPRGRSDDGCIGNRRVRTIIISFIIGFFFVFACGLVEFWAEYYKDLEKLGPIFGELACTFAASGDPDVSCGDFVNAWWFIFSGAITCIIGCVLAVGLFLFPSFENNLGRVAGMVLIIGGSFYLGGWVSYISLLIPPDDIETGLTEEAEEQRNAILTGYFGEALLAAGSAILLGLDALLQIYEREFFRLASFLGIIMSVSGLGFNAYYLQICSKEEEDNFECVQYDGVGTIATGYLILFWVCTVYIVLYVCTCCTCNCKDKPRVRLLIAVVLVIGGLVTMVGYWIYVGSSDNLDSDDVDTDSYTEKVIVYYIGYSVLVGGSCFVWALDMAFDDVKNNRR